MHACVWRPAPLSMTTKPSCSSGIAGDHRRPQSARLRCAVGTSARHADAGELYPCALPTPRPEWFSHSSGTFTIETADFRLIISELAWRFHRGRNRRARASGSPTKRAHSSSLFAPDGRGGVMAGGRRMGEITHASGTNFVQRTEILHERYGRRERYRRLIEKHAPAILTLKAPHRARWMDTL